MSLPLISDNMQFDTILKAIELVLRAEAENQIKLNGTGWKTVRERFDPWNVVVDKMNPGVANIVWTSSNYDSGESTQFENSAISTFSIDCYVSAKATESGWNVVPKDQNAGDVLHTLIAKVYYTVMSRINIDMGLTAGTIVQPFVTRIDKYIPTESNILINGIIAARISCQVKHLEIPPEGEGVPLNVVNVKSYKDEGQTILYVETEVETT